MSNGKFDGGLHRGHLAVLACCRQLAGPDGEVIVALNSDASVRELAGPGRPLLSFDERKAVLEALRYVDYVRPFTCDAELESMIQHVSPDFYVKGFDSIGKPQPGLQHIRQMLYLRHNYSEHTSDLVQRIKEGT